MPFIGKSGSRLLLGEAALGVMDRLVLSDVVLGAVTSDHRGRLMIACSKSLRTRLDVSSPKVTRND
jgi:hypothetical protein